MTKLDMEYERKRGVKDDPSLCPESLEGESKIH